MKELSIEEKAKRYDEAIKYGQYLINERCKEGTDGSFHRADLNKMFPELKESEGERIRKALIRYFTLSDEHAYNEACGVSYRDIVAWLEKQGNLMGALQEANKKIGELVEENYYLKEQGEQKPVINTITPEESLGIDSETYSKIVDECIYGEQKPAWSEEDEKMWAQVINEIEAIKSNSSTIFEKNIAQDKIDWLKSLKDRVQPQNTWKPSDEQIKAVKEAACYSSVFSGKTIDNLISLSKQLKKLREE